MGICFEVCKKLTGLKKFPIIDPHFEIKARRNDERSIIVIPYAKVVSLPRYSYISLHFVELSVLNAVYHSKSTWNVFGFETHHIHQTALELDSSWTVLNSNRVKMNPAHSNFVTASEETRSKGRIRQSLQC